MKKNNQLLYYCFRQAASSFTKAARQFAAAAAQVWSAWHFGA